MFGPQTTALGNDDISIMSIAMRKVASQCGKGPRSVSRQSNCTILSLMPAVDCAEVASAMPRGEVSQGVLLSTKVVIPLLLKIQGRAPASSAPRSSAAIGHMRIAPIWHL
ncbi:hypothetical protein D3C81_1164430 [compost metagenome]